jgi:hypothetical protein
MARQFSTLLTKRAPEAVTLSKVLHPTYCVSEYGDLLNIKPLTKPPTKEDFREVIMLDDNSDVASVQKKMNHNPRAYFLFSPKGHW